MDRWLFYRNGSWMKLHEPRRSARARLQALAEAVATLNAFNPKNKQAYALETAPSHWKLAIEETALRILYQERAAAFDATDPALARSYRAHGEHHRKLSESLAKPLLQIRPTSMGSGGRR
jgi:hypothetical protein